MTACRTSADIRTTGYDITIGAGIPLGLPFTFLDTDNAPYPVDADTVTAWVGDLDLDVAQTDTNVVTVSASALDLAAIKGVKTWTFAVGGVPWLTGTFRVTTSPGCSSTGETVVVNTSPEPVNVHVDSAALAGQVADLTQRLDALEAQMATVVVHTPIGG